METNLSILLVTVLDEEELLWEKDGGLDGLSLAIRFKNKSKPCTFYYLIWCFLFPVLNLRPCSPLLT